MHATTLEVTKTGEARALLHVGSAIATVRLRPEIHTLAYLVTSMVLQGTLPPWSNLWLIRSWVDRRSETTEDLSSLCLILRRVLLTVSLLLDIMLMIVSRLGSLGGARGVAIRPGLLGRCAVLLLRLRDWLWQWRRGDIQLGR